MIVNNCKKSCENQPTNTCNLSTRLQIRGINQGWALSPCPLIKTTLGTNILAYFPGTPATENRFYSFDTLTRPKTSILPFKNGWRMAGMSGRSMWRPSVPRIKINVSPCLPVWDRSERVAVCGNACQWEYFERVSVCGNTLRGVPVCLW